MYKRKPNIPEMEITTIRRPPHHTTHTLPLSSYFHTQYTIYYFSIIYLCIHIIRMHSQLFVNCIPERKFISGIICTQSYCHQFDNKICFNMKKQNNTSQTQIYTVQVVSLYNERRPSPTIY